MSKGPALIMQLKEYILEKMRAEPMCAESARGLGNNDLEDLCDLELHLDSQDHYLTYSLLASLVKDGIVEQVRWPETPRRPKYRLKTT
jgi:hypothetical protein